TKILGLLEELEIVTSKIVKMDKYNKENAEFSKALEIVQGILDAELHHKREEDVLFPELEKREITGPTRIMRLEHDQLREKKRRLKELIKVVEYLDFEDFKDNLQSL
ncbi:MAG: hemerythrin domain-containing protein, partial [Clostridium perfringens]